MMISKQTLLAMSERFRALSGDLPETTLSHRMFGDTKKLGALRAGSDITVGRFNAALRWLASEWPDQAELPDELRPYALPSEQNSEDAA